MKLALRRCCLLALPIAALMLVSCATPWAPEAPPSLTFKLSPANDVFDLEAEGLKTLWQQELGQIAGRQLEDISCTGRFVVVQATDGEIHCFDAVKGTWEADHFFQHEIVRDPAQMGSVVVLVAGDTVYGLDTTTGKIGEGYNPPFAVSATPVPYGEGLILAGANGHLERVPVVGAYEIWRTSIEGPIFETPVVDNGRLFAAGDGDKVVALDPETGVEAWRWMPEKPSVISSGVAVYGEVVHVGDTRGFVYALNREVGAPEGSKMLDAPLVGQPQIIGGRLMVLTTKPALVCLTPGAVMDRLWEYAGVTRVLSAGERTVYVLNADHSVAAVSLETGEEIWRQPLPPDCMVAGDPSRPAFYVANAQGSIAAFAELE